MPFRSIARNSRDSALVTLLDGRRIVVSDTREASHENRGIYVDDRRYGRVLVSWDAFERVDFTPGGSGPACGDFPPGRPANWSKLPPHQYPLRFRMPVLPGKSNRRQPVSALDFRIRTLGQEKPDNFIMGMLCREHNRS